MSSVATPYGFKPVGRLSNRDNNNGMRQISIASGYAANIGYGDSVKIVSGGTIQRDTGTTAMTPVGIFLGCYFTDPNTHQPSYHQSWSSGTVASDALAYICDDPDVVFQIQANGTLSQSALGLNAAVVQTAPVLIGINYFSQVTVDYTSPATTNTFPVRILDFVIGPTSAIGDAYTDLICTWNWGMHQYRNALAV